jgi:hypothetical protein
VYVALSPKIINGSPAQTFAEFRSRPSSCLCN